MKKGQIKLIEKAKRLSDAGQFLKENIKYLESDDRLCDLKIKFDILQNIPFVIKNEDVANALFNGYMYGSVKALCKNHQYPQEINDATDKESMYRILTGIKDWDYIKNVDWDFYLLHNFNDLTDKKRVRAFIDLFDEKEVGYYYSQSFCNELILMFNYTNKIEPDAEKRKQLLLEANPVYKFCTFSDKWVYDEQAEQFLLDNSIYDITIKSTNSEYYLKKNYKAITLNVYTYPSLTVFNDGVYPVGEVRPVGKAEYKTLLSFHDNIVELFRGSYIPLTLKRAKMYAEDEVIKDFIQTWLKARKENIAREIMDLPNIPIPIAEALKYENIGDMMNRRYKDAHKINWNRVDIEKGYYAMKCLSKIENPDIYGCIIFDMLNRNKIEIPKTTRVKNIVNGILANALIKRTGVDEKIACAYVNCAKKVNLRYGKGSIEKEYSRLMGEW